MHQRSPLSSPFPAVFVAVATLLVGAACGRPELTGEEEPPGPASSLPPSGATGSVEPLPPPAVLAASWGAPAAIHTLPGRSDAPALTPLGGGKVLAVWTQSHPTAPYRRTWSAELSGGQWGTPQLLTAEPVVSEVSVASARDGTAVAAWLQSSADSTRTLATASWQSGTWSARATLTSLTWQQGALLQPRAAAGRDGLAVVVWASRAPAAEQYTVWASSRPRGGAFGGPLSVAAGLPLGRNAEAGAQLDAAVDGAGGLLIAWVEAFSDRVEVWARRGKALEGSVGPLGFESPTRVATELDVPGTSAPAFGLWAGFHQGRFFTAWLRGGLSGHTLASRHQRPDGAWDAEAEAAGIKWTRYAPPRLAASAGGDKVLVWREGSEAGSQIVARRFDAEKGWGPTEVVAGGLAPPYLGCIDIDAHFHDVAIDDSGAAIAVWEERVLGAAGTRSAMQVRASRLLPATGWGAPARLDAGSGKATRPVAALEGAAQGVAVWSLEQQDGSAPLHSALLAPGS